MVTNEQVRRLKKQMQTKKNLGQAAIKSGMSEKTARKYLRCGKLPSEMKRERYWQTRENPYKEVWPEIKSMLSLNPGLEAKTIFEHLQRKYKGHFSDGQLRTLQRHIKKWRAIEGAEKEVYFPQIHYPGKLCQSDFTHMDNLGITINNVPFKHMLYHFILTYSNWETGNICYSESFESLSEGMQKALWKLGGVPQYHQTDRLSAAINNNCNAEEFTGRYNGLLKHYKLQGKKIQGGKANENGDIEQRHYRFKKTLEQSLMLRGSKNFNSISSYEQFLENTFSQLNSGRMQRFQEEVKKLKNLPLVKLDSKKQYRVKVGPSSTININKNTYSVNSRLIGEKITVLLSSTKLEIWYAQKRIDIIPRIKGSGKSRVNYRHIIDSLIRKPGAFENYRHKKDMFPGHRFRIAYDNLKKMMPIKSNKEYLKILYLAARENETKVDNALEHLINSGKKISYESVEKIVKTNSSKPPLETAKVEEVDLKGYDQLLYERQVI